MRGFASPYGVSATSGVETRASLGTECPLAMRRLPAAKPPRLRSLRPCPRLQLGRPGANSTDTNFRARHLAPLFLEPQRSRPGAI